MRKILMEEIIPAESSFTLKKTGTTYRLRAFTIADQCWMKLKYGDSVQAKFKSVDVDFISEFVMRLLHEEDRTDFIRRKCKVFNENTGEQTEEMIGGAALFKHFVSGQSELLGVLKAIIATIGISQPLFDELSGAEAKAQKKTLKVEEPAGPGSSSTALLSGDAFQTKSAG